MALQTTRSKPPQYPFQDALLKKKKLNRTKPNMVSVRILKLMEKVKGLHLHVDILISRQTL